MTSLLDWRGPGIGRALRQTLTGALSIQDPRSRRGTGPAFRPTSEATRIATDRQVCAELERQGALL